MTSCGCPLCRDVGDAELSLADVVGDAAALSADIGGDVQPDPPKKDLVSKIAELKARRTMLVNFFSLTSDSGRRCLFQILLVLLRVWGCLEWFLKTQEFWHVVRNAKDILLQNVRDSAKIREKR